MSTDSTRYPDQYKPSYSSGVYGAYTVAVKSEIPVIMTNRNNYSIIPITHGPVFKIPIIMSNFSSHNILPISYNTDNIADLPIVNIKKIVEITRRHNKVSTAIAELSSHLPFNRITNYIIAKNIIVDLIKDDTSTNLQNDEDDNDYQPHSGDVDDLIASFSSSTLEKLASVGDIKIPKKYDDDNKYSDSPPTTFNDNDEHKELFNGKFTNECDSISSCDSLKRIANCLCFYQTLKDSQYSQLLIYLNDNNYPHLINDYNHILTKHIGDHKSVQESHDEFEMIYNEIMLRLKPCDIQNCTQFTRNNRDRQKTELLLKNCDDSEELNLLTYYIDTLDTIHCNLVHSYDTGYRLRASELKQSMNNKNNKQNKHNTTDSMIEISKINRDTEFENIRTALLRKQQSLKNIDTRDTNTAHTTKFMSNMEHHHAMKKCDDMKEEDCKTQHVATLIRYSFGYRYYYWLHYKEKDGGWDNMYPYKDLYISAKYNNLKDELLNNKTETLNKETFDIAIKTATEKSKSEHAKSITAPIGSYSLRDKYEINPGSNISLQHLVSVILYCNYDKLSFEFSKTFRKLKISEDLESCKLRNKEYAIWSRLLRETVEIYGTEMWCSKIKTFYHGISCKLVFESFISYFSSPTSCTVSLSIATIFAKATGIILELECDHPYLRYFSCPWLSTFSNEDERLFIGGWRPIKIGSIRSVNDNQNYRLYVHAFSFFNYCVIDDNPMDGTKANKKDYGIISKLIKHKNIKTKYKNKFPKYMNDIFETFCKNKTKIKINIKKMNYYYQIMTSLFFSDENKYLFLVHNICDLFTNCTNIEIQYDGQDKPNINSFFDQLMQELIIYSKNNKINSLHIMLKNIKYSLQTLTKYSSQFLKNNWLIQQETDIYAQNKLSISHNNNM